MSEKLGICVTTTSHLPHVIGLAKAARASGKEVEVFFTGEAVRLTKEPAFGELIGTGRVTVCEVSYIGNGYQGEEVPGLVYKDFVTQARNAEMVDDCDRYIVL